MSSWNSPPRVRDQRPDISGKKRLEKRMEVHRPTRNVALAQPPEIKSAAP